MEMRALTVRNEKESFEEDFKWILSHIFVRGNAIIKKNPFAWQWCTYSFILNTYLMF